MRAIALLFEALTALLRAYRADAAAHEHSFLAAVTVVTTLLETSPLVCSAISGDQTLLSLLLGTLVAAVIVNAVNWAMKRHKQERTTHVFAMDRSNVSFVPLGDGLVASTRRVAFDGKLPVDAEAKEFLCVGKVSRGR